MSNKLKPVYPTSVLVHEPISTLYSAPDEFTTKTTCCALNVAEMPMVTARIMRLDHESGFNLNDGMDWCIMANSRALRGQFDPYVEPEPTEIEQVVGRSERTVISPPRYQVIPNRDRHVRD